MNDTELAQAALRATPASAVSGLLLFGVQLQDWVLLASLLLIALQIGFLLRDKLYKPWKAKHDRSKRA